MSKRDILQDSGYTEGDIPFKYLGVNISAKKFSYGDWQILIDKIVARIKSWGSRTLSYAGRAQLENSVLLNMLSYWASILILPKRVLDGVIAVCWNYLWDGKPVYSRSPPIAWEIICMRKDQGGLGFHDSYIWNIAFMGKYIWNIVNQNESLWLRWVNHVYLKGKNWKRYKCPNDASWYWKQIWKVRYNEIRFPE